MVEKMFGSFFVGLYFWLSRILLRAAEAEKSARGEIGAVPALFQRSRALKTKFEVPKKSLLTPTRVPGGQDVVASSYECWLMFQ